MKYRREHRVRLGVWPVCTEQRVRLGVWSVRTEQRVRLQTRSLVSTYGTESASDWFLYHPVVLRSLATGWTCSLHLCSNRLPRGQTGRSTDCSDPYLSHFTLLFSPSPSSCAFPHFKHSVCMAVLSSSISPEIPFA